MPLLCSLSVKKIQLKFWKPQLGGPHKTFTIRTLFGLVSSSSLIALESLEFQCLWSMKRRQQFSPKVWLSAELNCRWNCWVRFRQVYDRSKSECLNLRVHELICSAFLNFIWSCIASLICPLVRYGLIFELLLYMLALTTRFDNWWYFSLYDVWFVIYKIMNSWILKG